MALYKELLVQPGFYWIELQTQPQLDYFRLWLDTWKDRVDLARSENVVEREHNFVMPDVQAHAWFLIRVRQECTRPDPSIVGYLHISDENATQETTAPEKTPVTDALRVASWLGGGYLLVELIKAIRGK